MLSTVRITEDIAVGKAEKTCFSHETYIQGGNIHKKLTNTCII